MAALPEVAAPLDALPSLGWAALRVLGAVGLLGLGAWTLARWSRRVRSEARSLRVLERACLTRGASVALVSVLGRRLLLGVSNDGVRLLSDLGPADAREPAPRFERVLAAAAGSPEAAR
jgi:flagellar biogenesis protein FliO